MNEWESFDKITNGKGVWLIDSKGNKIMDAVASMWCNVWGHSNPQLNKAITDQSKKIQHSSLFNLTNEPAEKLADTLVKISPKMHKVFYSDNGSSAMEIAIKMALQYWKNIGNKKKTEIATLENGYHGDTFGAMSVGYVPEFFGKFKKQLFTTIQFPVPNEYRTPKGFTFADYQNHCLEKIEKRFSKNDNVAAFVMESGAQVAGGVIIHPKGFQSKISGLCKKYDVLFVLDEIATGFGRLGSMVQYEEQKSTPDIVAYGKMLTGGYLTMAATLASKKIYDSFLGEFNDWVHLFHGHTYTGNPIAAAVANENMKMYKKHNLIKKVQRTSKIFDEFYDDLSEIDIVGDIRHKGMLMGIELVRDRQRRSPILPQKSINKIFFEEGKKTGIYLRTLGNIVMLVPPLAITENELRLLLQKTVKTIHSAKPKVV
jgi:adenosylmethionine-8-amino-7-oxononanoate aminotransferase